MQMQRLGQEGKWHPHIPSSFQSLAGGSAVPKPGLLLPASLLQKLDRIAVLALVS